MSALTEEILHDLNLLSQKLSSLELEAKKLNQQEDFIVAERTRLTERENKAKIARVAVDRDKELIIGQRKWIDNAGLELKAKEATLEKRKQLLSSEWGSLETQKKELNEREIEIAAQQKKLDEKIEKSKEIDTKLEDIGHRETMLLKEKEIDKERKAMLDIRESKIVQKEARLQKIAEM